MLPPVPALPAIPSHPAPARLRRGALWTAAATALLLSVVTHAGYRRGESGGQAGQATRTHIRQLPSQALVLSTRSRWLRHPLLSEPGAAFSEGPAFPDNDAAGALQNPPRAFHAEVEASP